MYLALCLQSSEKIEALLKHNKQTGPEGAGPGKVVGEGVSQTQAEISIRSQCPE